MSFKIAIVDKTGFKQSAAKFKENLESVLLKKGNELKASIVSRTKAGVDIYGRAFAPYRPFTIEQKIKKGQQIAPVNLTDTGEMLNSIQSTVQNKNTISIKVTRKQDVAIELQTGRPDMVAREFFGLTDEDVENIVLKDVVEHLL